jgi:hypothetical protein
MIPDTLVLARGEAFTYRGGDLIASWGRLEPTERSAIEEAAEEGFAAWIEQDAGVVLRAATAEAMGIEMPAAALGDAETDWGLRVIRWAEIFGFGPALADEQILAAAIQSVLSGAPEARAARLELRSLRPRLRALYPIVATEP